MTKKYLPGQKVELRILRETQLGFIAKINEVDDGLLYHNEIFEKLEPQQIIPGYIKLIRANSTIDLQLHAFGNFGAEELGQQILNALKSNKGFIPLNAKSPAQEIHDAFGVSKKIFKMALGGLYKKRLVIFVDEGTELKSGKF